MALPACALCPHKLLDPGLRTPRLIITRKQGDSPKPTVFLDIYGRLIIVNTFVLPSDAVSASGFVDRTASQRQLSVRLDYVQLNNLPVCYITSTVMT